MKRIIYAVVGLLGFLAHAQTGPGGVGNSSNNALWLDATKLTGFSNGDAVSSWPDVSGNGWTATTTIAGREPSFISSGFGSRAGVVFNQNNNDFMTIPHHASLNLTTGGFLAAVVRRGSNIGGAQGVFCKRYDFNDRNHYGLLFNPQFRVDANGQNIGGSNGTGAVNANTGAIISGAYAGSAVNGFINGTPANSGTAGATPSPNNADFFLGTLAIGGTPATDRDFDGIIHEVVVFNAPLNDAQRLIVLNYLGAKYGQSLGLATRFSNYTYGQEVAGVGRAASGQEHLVAQGPGLLRITASGLANDRWLLWGHNGAALSRSASKPSGITEILSRTWRFEETGAVPAVTISLDQATLEGLFPLFARGMEVIVSSDATFDGSDPTYPLALNAGRYEASIDLPTGGSFVTLVQRGFILLDQGQWSGGLLSGKPDVNAPADHGKDLVISGSGTLDVSARIDNLEILSGQSLEVSSGHFLRVDGTATNNGSLTLRATSASAYGQYYGPQISGVTLEVFATGNGWRNIASPFTGMTLGQFQAANTAGKINTSSFPNLYSYDPQTCGGANIGVGSTQAWGTWVPMTTASSVLVGQGFNLFSHPFYGNANTPIALTGTTPDPSTPQNVLVYANNGGWNMVPNPFPCTIDWVDVFSTNSSMGIDGFMHVWDPATSQYKTTDNTGLSTNGGSRYLAPGQAFWVRNTSSSTSGSSCVDFANPSFSSLAVLGSHRNPDQAPPFFKEEAKPVGTILFEIKNTLNNRTDQLYVQFDSSWSNAFVPGEDGLKFLGQAPNLYAVQDNQQLVFARYHISADSVLLGVQAAHGEPLQLKLMSNNSNWSEFELVDLATQNTVPFDSVFDFVQDSSYSSDRWVLRLSNPAGIGQTEPEVATFKAWFGHGQLRIETSGNAPLQGVEIMSLTGQLLRSFPANETQWSAPVMLPTGIYLIRTRQEGVWTTTKLLHP
jgi:hypothetical protein